MTAYVDYSQCQVHQPMDPVTGVQNPYYAPSKGDNIWSYYFEQPGGTVKAAMEDKKTRGELFQVAHSKIEHFFGDDWRDDTATSTCQDDRKSLMVYFVGCQSTFIKDNSRLWTKDVASWFSSFRANGHDTMKQMPIKAHIRSQADKFWNEHLAGTPVLGVHLRGTDKQPFAGRKINPGEYFRDIDAFLAKNLKGKIFLATEDSEGFATFQEKYGLKVMSQKTARYDNGINQFVFDQGEENYHKGVAVLLDALLLSKTDYMLHGQAGVPELAIWLSQDMRLDKLSKNLNFCHEAKESACKCGFYHCGIGGMIQGTPEQTNATLSHLNFME